MLPEPPRGAHLHAYTPAMTLLSRAARRSLALPLLVITTLTVGGCGSNHAPSATPTLPRTSPAATAAASPATETPPTESPTASATADTATGRNQVVKVEKYGVAFELPKGWITLDAKKVLTGTGKNPILDELANRMGTTPEKLAQTFSAAVQTFSVTDEGAHDGFLDNVNTVGQDQVLNDDSIKLQLATVGAKPGTIVHASSAAGDVTRVPYVLPTKTGLTVQAVAVVVHTAKATVVVTVSSSTAAAAARIADQVEASLKPIPGNGPAA